MQHLFTVGQTVFLLHLDRVGDAVKIFLAGTNQVVYLIDHRGNVFDEAGKLLGYLRINLDDTLYFTDEKGEQIHQLGTKNYFKAEIRMVELLRGVQGVRSIIP